MKLNYFYFIISIKIVNFNQTIMKILFILLCLSFSFWAFNQGQSDNHAQRFYIKKNEVVVRFNHTLLDPSKIDNENFVHGELKDFFHPVGKEFLKKVKKLPIDKLIARKVFTKITTCDKYSLSRTGETILTPPFWATFVIKIPHPFTVEEAILLLKDAYPVVVYAHANYIFENGKLDVPNDPGFNTYQHSLNSLELPNAHINMDNAWNIETGKKHIKVGVFDSGIDNTHEDLSTIAISMNLNSTVVIGEDEYGHGTPVAGIIGAKRNNGIGISGIAGGNNTTDNEGVSLIDFNTNLGYATDVEAVSAQIIDGARTVGSYYDWSDINPSFDNCNNVPGYGIHIGNHSYAMFVKYLSNDTLEQPYDTLWDVQEGQEVDCALCYEAFLFSLKNGVVNVASRGNTKPYIPDQTIPAGRLPAALHDSWVISVGASGKDGRRIDGTNGTTGEANFSSPIGQDLDLIAPGSNSIVYSTRSSQTDIYDGNNYGVFNGTSAAAPHVSGVAALLLSKYNKDSCYSNLNLDPADVEYILQKSATDVHQVGYDDTSGWGRLDAYHALKMINFPEYQIVHPQNEPINIEVLSTENIIAHLVSPLTNYDLDLFNGPLGAQFPLRPNDTYEVEKVKFQLTYSFASPYFDLPSTQLLDAWVRHSPTNSLIETVDTTGSLQLIGQTGQYEWVTEADNFHLEPMAEIAALSNENKTITLTGFYYHFIKRFNTDNVNMIDYSSYLPEDYWYPINPNIIRPKMAYSIYLRGPDLTSRFDYPCDSINELVDVYASNPSLQLNDFVIFPNPGTEELTIRFEQATDAHILLTDFKGQEIRSFNAKNKQITIDTDNLNTGVYFIQLNTNHGNIIKKWVKL